MVVSRISFSTFHPCAGVTDGYVARGDGGHVGFEERSSANPEKQKAERRARALIASRRQIWTNSDI
jgi:hypothetical protein